MGMTVKVTSNPGLVVQLAAARRRGLQEAGAYILAIAMANAPREDGEPIHGYHGADTGFVRLEAELERVAIGFEAFWMLWQHERMDYKHTHGHAKFLELALLEYGETALGMVAAAMREAA